MGRGNDDYGDGMIMNGEAFGVFYAADDTISAEILGIAHQFIAC